MKERTKKTHRIIGFIKGIFIMMIIGVSVALTGLIVSLTFQT